jgi:hypothetical protein
MTPATGLREHSLNSADSAAERASDTGLAGRGGYRGFPWNGRWYPARRHWVDLGVMGWNRL